MTNTSELRSGIFKNYKSIAECAKAAGMSRNVLYNIVNNTKIPDSREIAKIGKVCNFSEREIAVIFLGW